MFANVWIRILREGWNLMQHFTFVVFLVIFFVFVVLVLTGMTYFQLRTVRFRECILRCQSLIDKSNGEFRCRKVFSTPRKVLR